MHWHFPSYAFITVSTALRAAAAQQIAALTMVGNASTGPGAASRCQPCQAELVQSRNMLAAHKTNAHGGTRKDTNALQRPASSRGHRTVQPQAWISTFK